MSSNHEVIQFENVYFSFGDVPILKDITGSFYEGKITTIVGPSGSGKTTLFRLCNGLISSNSGEILVKGKKIDWYNQVELRQMVGIALQSATMISGSVWKNLSLPLTLQGKKLPEEKAKELLTMVGMEEKFLNQNVKDLSGGQRQKVSIARTLVNQPEVLLLDEITSSLDRVSQEEIEELIVRINKEYFTTVIWITHNLEQARSIGDYTWVMMGGEVIEIVESNLLLHSKNERVQQFVRGDIE